jgi:hypothetical protein
MNNMEEKEVISLSKDLNEPKWLLHERLRSLKVYSVLSKDIGKALDAETFGTPDTNVSLAGARRDSLHDFLEDPRRKDIAKSFFINRFYRPEKSIESAFINAFFTECNFFAPEKESATMTLTRKHGIAIDFFIILARANLGLNSDSGGASISEYYLSDNASLFQSSTITGKHSLLLEARILQNDAQAKLNHAFFSTAKKTNNTLLNGENSKYAESLLFVTHSHDRLDVSSTILHASKSTDSTLTAKGVVKDNAVATVNSLARISHESQGSKSRLSTHAMILTPGAKATVNPDFEILNNDVIASHSASVGEINEEQLFYLMSRGFSRDKANQLIIEGFLDSALPEGEKALRGKLDAAISALYKSSSLK